MNSSKIAGLSSVVAGSTAICTVGKQGVGLSYRGYAIEELAEQASFEEVAYLLLYGELPNQQQLEHYQTRLLAYRTLPDALKQVLEKLPKTSHPMDVLRTGCSALGCLEPEFKFTQQHAITDRLLAIFPGILLYWYHFHKHGTRIEGQTEETSLAGHFLHLLKGKPPSSLERKVMDVSLTLYAEHEFNASTFAARVAASTLSDMYSAITAAIGTLRGSLHGGANEAAMALIQSFSSVADVEAQLTTRLAHKEKIMGFGHRVYKNADPRSPIIKKCSQELAQKIQDKTIFATSEKIETCMWRQKKLFPNLDFYSASAYYFMNIPIALYTPIFVCSRITGWAAHIFEQRENNALIRPNANYIGPARRRFITIEQRQE